MQTPIPLNDVIATLRHKYGQRVIQTAKQTESILQSYSTGIRVLDQLLEGGLLYQHVNVFTGKPTSGATTCAYHAIASLQQVGYEGVYLDLPQTFDAVVASACNVTVEKILLVHPPQINRALALMRDIALSGVPCLMVLDVSGYAVSNSLNRKQLRLAQSQCFALLLAPYATDVADISVHFQHLDWIQSGRDVSAYQLKATLQHHPRIPSREVQFTLPITWEVSDD